MSYLTDVMADNPVHFWRCADPGGKWANDIGSSPLGLVARASFDILGYTGPNSDGGSAIFTIQAALWEVDRRNITVPLTLEAVFFQHNIDARLQVVFTTEIAGVSSPCGMGIDATGKPYMSNTGTLITAAAAPTFNAWHHMVATHTGAIRTLYIDGVQVAAQANVVGTLTGSLSVGGTPPNSTQAAEMFISEVAFYNTALTAARVSAHYAALDNLASKPVFKPYGNFAGGTGTSTFTTQDVQDILSAVRRTFPTT